MAVLTLSLSWGLWLSQSFYQIKLFQSMGMWVSGTDWISTNYFTEKLQTAQYSVSTCRLYQARPGLLLPPPSTDLGTRTKFFHRTILCTCVHQILFHWDWRVVSIIWCQTVASSKALFRSFRINTKEGPHVGLPSPTVAPPQTFVVSWWSQWYI